MATGSQSSYKGSDEIPNYDCDVCLSNSKTVEAISYCTTCCENLCMSCDLSHRGSRASRSHTILTGSNVPSVTTRTKPTLPFMFCDTHKTTLLNIYCPTHDEVICQACAMNMHKTCATGDISGHSGRLNVKKEIKTVSKSLSDLTTRYDDLTKNRHIDKSTVQTQIKEYFSDMHQLRTDINDKLDHLEKKMSFELRDIEEIMNKEIDAHITLSDDILRKIEDLEKSVFECQKARENDVMFVGIKKASSRASEYGNIFDNLQKNIYPPEIRFQPNDVLTDMIQKLQSLGTVSTNRPIYTGHSQPSILNISLKEKQELDVKSDIICGCTFLSDGHLVLACSNDGIKLFDKNFKFKSQSSIPAADVSAIDDTDIIVTQGDLKKLQRVRVLPNMVAKKTLKMDRYCWSVNVYAEEIYVTCHDNPGKGEVRVLSMDGKIQRRLGVNNDTYKFTSPYNVKVNSDGSKVFVSDWNPDSITCLNNQGHVIYQYCDRDIKNPVGMYVDREDNLFVCGLNSYNVHVVRHGGRKETSLLSEKDGIQYPWCISYRESDGYLVVCLSKRAATDKKVIIFRTR